MSELTAALRSGTDTEVRVRAFGAFRDEPDVWGLPDPGRPRPGERRAAGPRHRRGHRGRRRGCRPRALAHLVRELRGPDRAADLRHPPRRHRPQPRAAPPVEGRAARRRLPPVQLDGARGVRTRRRRHRGLQGHARGHPALVPVDRPGEGPRRLQRHRHRRVEADRRRGRRPRPRHRPDAPERRVRRTHHPPEGPAVPAPCRGVAAVGRADRAVRRRAGHPRDPGRGHRARRRAPQPTARASSGSTGCSRTRRSSTCCPRAPSSCARRSTSRSAS